MTTAKVWTKEEIREKVRDILFEIGFVKVKEMISFEAVIEAYLGQSVLLVVFIMRLEDEFDISFDEVDFETLVRVNDFVNVIERELNIS